MAKWKYWLGRAAADTLGYVAGNTYGAVGADILYQTMAKNGKPLSPPITPRKPAHLRGRRTSKDFKNHQDRYRAVGYKGKLRRTSKRRGGDDDYYASGKHRGKNHRPKRAKVAKLRPAVKRAIKQMLSPSDITGRMRKKVVSRLWFGGTNDFATGNYDNKQKVEYLSVPFAFTPASFMEAASILWHNLDAPSSSTPSAPTNSNFHEETFKMTVIDSSVDVTFRNNSKRTYIMKLYIIQPKKVAALEPKGDLLAQLEEQKEDTVVGLGIGQNVYSVNYEKLGLAPEHIPGWNKNWSYECVHITLQPGQTYVYRIQGPKWMEVDYMKFLNGGVYIEQQKFMRYMMCVYHTDLISTTGAGSTEGTQGYFCERGDINPLQYDGHGVLVDQTFHYHLKMPEQTGFQYGAGTVGQQKLNKRRYAYAYLDYIPGAEGTIIRVDDEAGGGLVTN